MEHTEILFAVHRRKLFAAVALIAGTMTACSRGDPSSTAPSGARAPETSGIEPESSTLGGTDNGRPATESSALGGAQSSGNFGPLNAALYRGIDPIDLEVTIRSVADNLRRSCMESQGYRLPPSETNDRLTVADDVAYAQTLSLASSQRRDEIGYGKIVSIAEANSTSTIGPSLDANGQAALERCDRDANSQIGLASEDWKSFDLLSATAATEVGTRLADLDLDGLWSRCMAEAGYTFHSPGEATAEFDMFVEEGVSGRRVQSKEEIDAMLRAEISQAQIDWSCWSELILPEMRRVREEVELPIVEANAELLDRLNRSFVAIADIGVGP